MKEYNVRMTNGFITWHVVIYHWSDCCRQHCSTAQQDITIYTGYYDRRRSCALEGKIFSSAQFFACPKKLQMMCIFQLSANILRCSRNCYGIFDDGHKLAVFTEHPKVITIARLPETWFEFAARLQRGSYTLRMDGCIFWVQVYPHYSAIIRFWKIWRITGNENRPIARARVCTVFVHVQLKPACTTEHQITVVILYGWRRIRVGRTLVSAGKLSLSCARLLAGRMITLWVKRPLSVSQHGQLSHPSLGKWVVG